MGLVTDAMAIGGVGRDAPKGIAVATSRNVDDEDGAMPP
jgi:hypothetical protein